LAQKHGINEIVAAQQIEHKRAAEGKSLDWIQKNIEQFAKL
jgi:hypothetical protein